LIRSRLSFSSNAGTAFLSSNNFGEENFFTKFQFQPNPVRSVDVCKNFFCSK
ncbi:hypothetical protein T12_8866, partial [Trichinella patagoniensis]